MKHTKKLTIKDYQGLTFNLQDHIQNLAQRESDIMWAKRWYTAELPKYEKPPRIKLTAGVFNMVRGFMNEFRP